MNRYIVLVIVFGIIILIGLALWAIETREECPRVIYGYKCHKGNPNYPKGCDHSAGAVAEAKWNMRRK